jgi:UDP-N-acetylglucosamine 3-dehydrogenase
MDRSTRNAGSTVMSAELRVGVVGLGFGANHARVIGELPNARLVAVADRDPERLRRYRGSGVEAYASHEDMLAHVRLDAALVCVPGALHLEVGLAAIEAGCAVLIEKPLAPTFAEGLQLLEAARRAGVALMPGHIERFNPALQELARRLRGGEIGRVVQLTARRMGAIRYPPQDVNVVHDSAIHDIDTMRYVLNSEVEQVYASAQSGVLTPDEYSISGILRFAAHDNGPGAMATLETSWLSPRRVRDLAVQGENGLFLLRYAGQSLDFYRMPRRSGPVQGWTLWTSPEDGVATAITITPEEQLTEELGAFLEAVRTSSPMPVSPEDGLAALAIADALTLSARTGQPVSLLGGER